MSLKASTTRVSVGPYGDLKSLPWPQQIHCVHRLREPLERGEGAPEQHELDKQRNAEPGDEDHGLNQRDVRVDRDRRDDQQRRDNDQHHAAGREDAPEERESRGTHGRV